MNNKLIFLPIEIEISQTEFIIDRESRPTFGGMWNTKVLTEDDFDQLEIKKIVEQLPFEKITLGKYNIQMSDIVPHVDVQYSYVRDCVEFDHISENEPAGYRVLLEGKTDALEVFDGKQWRIAKLPSAPFVYLLNSTETKHRVLENSGRRSMYFRGFLDKKKHQETIKKNLEKFSDYAIYNQ
jgi:hypothetical protein